MFNESSTIPATTAAPSEANEITGYIDMFVQYLTMFLEAIKGFLAKLGISLGEEEPTTAAPTV